MRSPCCLRRSRAVGIAVHAQQIQQNDAQVSPFYSALASVDSVTMARVDVSEILTPQSLYLKV